MTDFPAVLFGLNTADFPERYADPLLDDDPLLPCAHVLRVTERVPETDVFTRRPDFENGSFANADLER